MKDVTEDVLDMLQEGSVPGHRRTECCSGIASVMLRGVGW